MSGSPIIQNGKFIGAVTHVLVNNPEEGYAVFGDIMLKQAKEVEWTLGELWGQSLKFKDCPQSTRL